MTAEKSIQPILEVPVNGLTTTEDEADYSEATRVGNEALLGIDGVRTLEVSDTDTLNRAFARNHETSYGATYTYLTQSTNHTGNSGLGYVYESGGNLATLTVYPRPEDNKQLAAYIILPMGDDRAGMVTDLTGRMRTRLPEGMPIFIKKADPELSSRMLQSGLYKTVSTEPWHPEIHSEDDTFPEMVLDIDAARAELQSDIAIKRSKLKKERRDAIKLDRRHEITFGSAEFEAYAWPLTLEFFEQIGHRVGGLNVSSPKDYYNMIFRNPDRQGLRRELVYVDGEPLGFFVTEDSYDGRSTNLHALITMRHRQNRLSDYITFHLLNTSQARYLNLGGSENIKLHEYKGKFSAKPSLREMRWLVNSG